MVKDMKIVCKEDVSAFLLAVEYWLSGGNRITITLVKNIKLN